MTGCVLPGFEERVEQENIIALATDTANDSCSAAALQVYTDQVHPTLVSKCASCHGSSQAPKFAVSDPTQGFVVAAGYVDLANPPNSKLHTKANDGHCGSASCQGTGASAPILAGVQAWSAAAAQGCSSTEGGSSSGAAASSSSSGATTSSSSSGGGGVNGVIKLKSSGVYVSTLTAAQIINICTQYEIWNTVNGFATNAPTTMSVAFSQQVYTAATCTAASLVSSLNINAGSNYRYFYSKEPAAIAKIFKATHNGNSVTLTVNVGTAPSPSPSTSVTPSPSPTATGMACTTTQKQNAYAATAWPIVKSKCTGCHATNAGRALFANSVLAAAYTPAATQAGPFSNVTASAMYFRSGNDHGGCGSVNCNSATQTSLLPQLQTWAQYQTSTDCSSLPPL